MQHEAAIDLDGAAEMHGRPAQPVIAERNLDLLEEGRQRHVDRLVDDDAEGAFGIVLAHVRERVGEVGIDHRRHRDQEMMREIHRLAHAVIVICGG